jgi:MoaA/NifB/PqqE/SkfB family radical SAM enzyme
MRALHSLRRDLIFAESALVGRRPAYVQYAVTTRCNQRCRMCDVTASRAGERELSVGQVRSLATVLRRMGVGVLVLSGGEPLLRSDLPAVVQAFAQQGLMVRMQSNGALQYPGQAQELASAGLQEVSISLHSLDPAVHDAITGREGSWEQALEGMAAFSQALAGRGRVHGVNITVCRPNLRELPRLVRFVTAIGFWAAPIPVHLAPATDREWIVRRDDAELALGRRDRAAVARIYDRLLTMKDQGLHVYSSRRFLRESAAWLQGGLATWRCSSPVQYFSISPQGRFLPCVDLAGEHSMLEPGFLERYRGAAFRREIRARVEACRGCMYACYPELVYIGHHADTLLERVGFALRVGRQTPPVLALEPLRELAARHRAMGDA